jgi:hypothetical protein
MAGIKAREGKFRPSRVESSSCRYNERVRRSLLILGFLFAIALMFEGHSFYTTKITWSADVSRVIYRNCISCHHPGGASFSLMTFREARPWAEDIKLQVLERRMPPWNAVKGFGEFKDDRGLPQEDLEIIAEWVDGGEPEGNPAYMPPAPDLTAESGDHRTERQDGARRLHVNAGATLKHAVWAVGIEPQLRGSNASLQAVAHFSSGEIAPLIWVEKFNPSYNKTYYFRQPLRFPAGTRIEISPGGALDLIVK